MYQTSPPTFKIFTNHQRSEKDIAVVNYGGNTTPKSIYRRLIKNDGVIVTHASVHDGIAP
jgi:hypothetical protein